MGMTGLDLTLIKSQHGPTYKVQICGAGLQGETLPIHIGLDEISPLFVHQIVRIYRADGSGKPVTYTIRLQVEHAVFEILSQLAQATDHSLIT